MTDLDRRNKLLHEKMGLKWNEHDRNIGLNIDFSTIDKLGELLRWASERIWWLQFLYWLGDRCKLDIHNLDPMELLSQIADQPAAFNNLTDWLKEVHRRHPCPYQRMENREQDSF
jgi:hypothetical protein